MKGYELLPPSADTVPPTAVITASSVFTNSLNVSVNVTFTEPCEGEGGGGFRCSSVDSCDLLVYGAGEVIPSSLTILEPYLKYSVMVALSRGSAYGRVVLVMNKNFCTDAAGNMFTRTDNSSSFVRFGDFRIKTDRRSVFVNMRTHVPERLLQLQGETRTVEATNSHDNLKVYLYFSEPIVNSSAEVLGSLNISGGDLVSLPGDSLGSRRFGFKVVNVSAMSIVTVALHSDSIISRPGTPVSPIAPATFLYDSEKPVVRLSTTSSTRTREHNIMVSIKFMKPVFGFNSSFVSISGGRLQRQAVVSHFRVMSRSSYITEVQAEGETVSISVPENITADIAGNKNLPSNVLQVRHLLTVSTSSLLSTGAFSRPSALLISEPTRSLFRIACYIQIFALSRWLAVMLPVEYYEFSVGLQWSIPYFTLPWEESGSSHSLTLAPNSSAVPHSSISRFRSSEIEKDTLSKAASIYGLPLTPTEYRFFFESEDIKPEADYVMESHGSNGWNDFGRSMFWLAVIGGGLILTHAAVFLIVKYKKNRDYSHGHTSYGALVFPRFEMFLLVLALPCICKASSGLVKGRTVSGSVLGILLLSFVGLLLLGLLFFLSIGITLAKLLQYKEVHQVGKKFHWYQELIRVTLGPGKQGQWTWKDEPSSIQLTRYGTLFEDLRGPPKYMLSQIGKGSTQERIIASDDETEDAEAPFIQKLFGILRIYYTFLESVKRVTLGIVAGAYASSWSSRTPSTVLLCLTAFQLFFVVLKKPFIKKKVQLVEIISLSCQVITFTICLVISKMEPLSTKGETRLGYVMVLVFLTGFKAHIANEWYALYRQIRRLDQESKSFSRGFKIAAIGFITIFSPKKACAYLQSKLPKSQEMERETGGGEGGSSAERNKSSGMSTVDRPWTRQLREMAKASFKREGSGTTGFPTDPSTSMTNKWSGLWGSKKSESSSSSQKSSADFKSKSNKLYKDLEAIFASKR
ncbi:hypothetical protein LINPERPRIM_LOCUS18596 [Linum perenne]